MEFGGRYLVSASRQDVWHALNNADTLKAAIPGCSRIDWTGDSALEVEITVNFGIVKPKFEGDLTLSNVIPGWQEAVPMMRVGETWNFAIPAHIAYGDRPVGPIPANSTLMFEIQLLEIK